MLISKNEHKNARIMFAFIYCRELPVQSHTNLAFFFKKYNQAGLFYVNVMGNCLC